MIIDIHSLAIILSITNFLQSVALLAQYRVNKIHSGPGWWALGSACLSAGYIFNYLRDDPRMGLFAIVANNAMFICGLALIYIGVLRYLGQRERRNWLIAICAAITLVAFYFTVIQPDLAARRVNFSVGVALLSFLIGWAFLFHKTNPIISSTRFLAVIFLLNAGFFTVRALFLPAAAPVASMTTPSLSETLAYLVPLVVSTLWTFGLIIMVNQRLNIETQEATQNQELIFNTSPDAILVSRLSDGCIINTNDKFIALTGFTRADALGKTSLEIHLWRDLTDRETFLALLAEKGFFENQEFILQRKDGSQFSASVSATVCSLQGQPHTITVTRDNTERKLAEKKLRESEQRFKDLIEKAADIILVIDATGIVQFASPAVESVTGYTPQEIIGQSFLEWMHPDDLPQAKIALTSRSQIAGTAPASMIVRARHKNGDWRFIEALGTNLLAESAINGIVLNLRDITATRQADQELQQRMLELSGLNELARRVNRSLSVNDVISTAVDEIVRALQPDVAMFFLREGDKLVLKSIQPASAKGRFGDVPEHRLGECLCGLALQQNKNIYSQDIFEDIRCVGRECKLNGLRAFAAIPLRQADDVIGVLGLASDTQRDFEQQDTFLEALIRQVSIALENASLYETAQREIEEREKMARELRESEGKFRSVIEQSADGIVLADQSGTVIEWNSGQEKITGLARAEATGKKLWDVLFHLNPLEAKTEEAHNRLRGSIQQALNDGFSPIFDRPYESSFLRPDGQRRVVQTMAFITTTANGHLLGSISRDVTEKKRNDDQQRRQLSELDVLFENSLAITRLMEPAQIGQKLIEILADKLDWHHAAIRLYHPHTGRLEVLALSHPALDQEELKAQKKRLNDLISKPGVGLSGWVIENKLAVRCARVKDDPRYIESYPEIQSGLYVPILSADEILGVISVESERENAFSEQDQRLLATLANQAAIAFQNAGLYTLSQQELSERKRIEQKLREAQAELEQRVRERTAEVQDLYDNAPCGYHSLDADGVFVHINETELSWLGYASQEVIGRPLKEFLSPEARQWFMGNFPLFKKSGILTDAELEFIRKDGSRLTLLVNATAINDENGNYLLSRSTLLDITRRKESEMALRESEIRLRQNRDDLSAANHALEKAARLKDEFLASMSHELRTPLTGILGLSEAMQLRTYGDLSDKQIRTLKNIETSGRHLLDLINDILDLSKIEAGRLDMQFEACSLNDICQASLQLTKGMAQQKHHNLAFSMQPANIVIRADKRRLKQMLVNLLSNAVKFTPDSGELGLEVLGSKDTGQIRITVWDKGIGIKAEDLPRLFKPFVQLDSSLSRQYAGTGLGLSLVQRMAEMHNGSMKVESTPGQGSRFTLTLPWDDSLSRPTALKRLDGTETLRALTIDHQPIDTETVTRYLHGMGIENRVRANAGMIVEYTALARPDLIFVELNLPDQSGLAVLVELKADERTSSIPVIIMSVEENRRKALALGASGYLVKPFSQADLRSELEGVFRVEVAAPTEPVTSPEGMLVLVADDNEENLQMLSDFLKSRKFTVEKARNGLELLDLAQQTHPRLMLVDIQMPEMDGLEAIRRIRAHEDSRLAATPIIAITALAMPGDRDNCLAAGANEYLSKPLELGKLVETIHMLVN